MKFTIDALEKERDWYFRKLQTIVVWLQTKCALECEETPKHF